VQGLVVDIHTGSLEWVANGYDVAPQVTVSPEGSKFPALDWVIGSGAANSAFEMGEMRASDLKIGETGSSSVEPGAAAKAPPAFAAPTAPAPPPIMATPQRSRAIPLPPPIRMKPGKRP